jgi:lipopolysaccharide export system permease protein
LYREIRRLEKEGARIANYILEWYQKPAAIFALVVMTLLGISLVQSAPRRGRAGLETAMTVLLGVLFWLSSEISFLLGKGEMIPALLAVWGPNLTFLGLAAGVYRRTF